MVAPVVGVSGEAGGDIATEARDIDDVGLVGAFFNHEGAAAVFGSLAHIEHLGAFFTIEELDFVKQVNSGDVLIDLHLGAAAGHLEDDVVVRGHRDGHFDSYSIEGVQQLVNTFRMCGIVLVQAPSFFLSFEQRLVFKSVSEIDFGDGGGVPHHEIDRIAPEGGKVTVVPNQEGGDGNQDDGQDDSEFIFFHDS